MMDGKIAAVLAKFGFGQAKRDAQLERLSDRVDNLIRCCCKIGATKITRQKSPE